MNGYHGPNFVLTTRGALLKFQGLWRVPYSLLTIDTSITLRVVADLFRYDNFAIKITA